ncbi:MAG: cytochrome c biogenesis CcdA family protein [Acidimicrobiia bacterium]
MLAVTSENVGIFVAFGGGIVSILSPCVLPMVPGYLSVVSGFSVAELGEGGASRFGRIALTTGLFTLGFGSVFTILGLAASGIGQAAFDNQSTLTRASGVLIMVMALYLAGSQVLIAPRLYPEKRLTVTRRFGWATAPIVGAAFGFGWSPCLGPVLAAVFGVAATQTTLRAVALLVSYSLGMGVSFLAVGLGFGASTKALAFLRRHLRTITLVSAAVLFSFGLLLALDRLSWLTGRLTDLLDTLGLSGLVDLG